MTLARDTTMCPKLCITRSSMAKRPTSRHQEYRQAESVRTVMRKCCIIDCTRIAIMTAVRIAISIAVHMTLQQDIPMRSRR